jgi:hypothetical protein
VVLGHGPDAPALADATSSPGIYLRRARAGVDAAAGAFRARLVAELAARPELPPPAAGATAPPTGADADTDADIIAGEWTGGAPRATEAFVAFAPHKAFSLAAGALRVPIGLSRRTDEADLRLPERARVVTRGTPDFRAGVAASGDLGLLQYDAGVYAASPTPGADFAAGGALTVVRLGSEPVGPVGRAPQLRRSDDPWYGWWRFAAGLTALHAALPGANELGLGGDGAFQWARLLVTGEVLWTHRAGADRIGFSVEPGVFVWRDRLELVARAEWLNEEVGPTSPGDAWGLALGATFLGAAPHARLQAAYTLRRPLAGGDPPSGWAVLRATFVM